jgi:hypothetical protein
MAYLEVRVENGTGGRIAVSANGVSLAKSSGCLAFFLGSQYPSAMDYFSGLEYEGWTLVSNQTSNTVGMIDGLPFASSNSIYTFRGNGRFEIEWDEQDRWRFKGYRNDDDYYDDDNY